MSFSKNKKQKVTTKVEITHSLATWLNMDLNVLSFIFPISVRVYNILRVRGVEKLGDIILFSRDELVHCREISSHAGNNLYIDEKRRIGYLQKKDLKQPGVGRIHSTQYGYKMGKTSIKEIDFIMKKLNLNLRKD